MNAAAEYGTLLFQIKPEVVHDEALNQVYVQQLENLTSKETISPAEEKFIQLLIVLVEEYENRYYPVPDARPLDILRHLMEVHQLRQKDLVDIFGAESTVSDVLNEKREITKEQVRRLSSRFHVSPAVFF